MELETSHVKYAWKNLFTCSLEYILANIFEIYMCYISYCFVLSDALWFLFALCFITCA